MDSNTIEDAPRLRQGLTEEDDLGDETVLQKPEAKKP